jgi:SpoVK/Ycf46/Vps4 family AAA+-type ATPase
MVWAMPSGSSLAPVIVRYCGSSPAIVSYQWKEHLERSALKGFLFHGGVGVGKTAMAKRLTYELCRRFGDNGMAARNSDEVVMILVDGADIARGRYGDTEEQIRDIFKYARDGQTGGHHRHDDDPKRRTIILFDDVESLFLTRNSAGAKEWHFSQNSIFFHSIDDLDTAHTAAILTTNRIDLVDEAIVDRFLSYEFAPPPVSVLEEDARKSEVAATYRRRSPTRAECDTRPGSGEKHP